MNLLKRIKNLWHLSEWEIPKKGLSAEIGDKFTNLFQPQEKPHRAQVINRRDPIKEVLKTDGI